MGRWAQSRNRGGYKPPVVSVPIPQPEIGSDFNALAVDVLFAEVDFGADPGLPDVTQFVMRHRVNAGPQNDDGPFAFESVTNLGAFVLGDLVFISTAWADSTGTPLSQWSDEIEIDY